MNTKPVFHGSDIEKICSYYHLDRDRITNFGANVNPLGLSEQRSPDILISFPHTRTGTILLCGVRSQNTAASPTDISCPGTDPAS